MKWLVVGSRRTYGPFEREQILGLLEEGRLPPDQKLRSADKHGPPVFLTASALRDQTPTAQRKGQSRVIGPGDSVWFLAGDSAQDEEQGPYSYVELLAMVKAGALHESAQLFRRRSNGQWTSTGLQQLSTRFGAHHEKPNSGARDPDATVPLAVILQQEKQKVESAHETPAEPKSDAAGAAEEVACWFVASRVEKGRQYGPYSMKQLQLMITTGKLTVEQNILRQNLHGAWESHVVGEVLPDAPSSDVRLLREVESSSFGVNSFLHAVRDSFLGKMDPQRRRLLLHLLAYPLVFLLGAFAHSLIADDKTLPVAPAAEMGGMGAPAGSECDSGANF